MNPKDIKDLLVQRDELIAKGEELADLLLIERIESDEIRELSKIVMETTNEDLVAFTTT